MKNYSLIFITVMFLTVLGMVFFSYLPGTCENCWVQLDEVAPPVHSVFPSSEELPVYEVYENGVHQVSGTLTLPDDCYEIIGLTTREAVFPEEVTIDLRTIRTSAQCPRQDIEKDFSVNFTASELVILNMSINGRPVKITYLD